MSLCPLLPFYRGTDVLLGAALAFVTTVLTQQVFASRFLANAVLRGVVVSCCFLSTFLSLSQASARQLSALFWDDGVVGVWFLLVIDTIGPFSESSMLACLSPSSLGNILFLWGNGSSTPLSSGWTSIGC